MGVRSFDKVGPNTIVINGVINIIPISTFPFKWGYIYYTPGFLIPHFISTESEGLTPL